MSGIIPPSIVTYSYVVDRNWSNYVNVSFPFRTQIEKIWFTGDTKLFSDDDQFGTERGLKLAAIKSRNPKNPVDQYDYPSDWNNFFGSGEGESGFWMDADEDLKPTMWIGNPDERPEGEAVQFAGFDFWGAGFRSTAKGAPAVDSDANGWWTNWRWDENEYNERRYKSDLSIMNPDEILTLMVYDYTGDWSNYGGDALVTIHVAYTGLSEVGSDAAGNAPWYDWWYD